MRSYNQRETLTREELINNSDFIEDAYTFLRKRSNLFEEGLPKPEEVYDEFLEHMRFQNANEITALRDYEYATSAPLEEKLRFGSLIDAFDKVDEGISMQAALDYGEAIARAPSTYLGIFTGGTGKVAAAAGTKAANLGLRKLLSEGMKSAAKAAAVEGTIGLGQGALQEGTRVKTGIQDEFTGGRTVQTGAVQAITGGLINMPVGMVQAKRASKANEKAELAKIASEKRAAEASTRTKDVLTTTSKEKVTKVKKVLNELDPVKVQKGRRIRASLGESSTLKSGLPAETADNIAAAVIRIEKELDIKEGERVTSAIARAFEDGKLDNVDSVKNILNEHNLSYGEFSLYYMAEISDAGRTLGSQSRIARALAKDTAAQREVDTLISNIDKLKGAGKSAFAEEEGRLILERPKLRNVFGNLDKARLSAMTAQPKTTARNTLNGGMRVFVDATTRTMSNSIEVATGRRNPLRLFEGSFDVGKYILNPYEARVMQQVFTDSFPEEAAQVFRNSLDIETRVGADDSMLANFGRKLNYLNTLSDNMFKKAVLPAQLNRRIKDARIPLTNADKKQILRAKLTLDLGELEANRILNTAIPPKEYQQLLKKYKYLDRKKFHDINTFTEMGEFGKIPDEILAKALDDTYEFVYQANVKGENIWGKGGKLILDAHRDVPFVISTFLPFPRFVANQLKFLNEHMPLVGLMQLDRIGAKGPRPEGYFTERLSKQLTGSAMLTTAYMWRANQGETNHWYEIKDKNGNIIDGRPIYGPFAPFIFDADMLYRYQSGAAPRSTRDVVTDGLQAFLGSTFRAGMGIYTLDKMYQDLSGDAPMKFGTEILANLANTAMIPVAAVKDVYAQFDDHARGVPETRLGEVNFLDILYRRATRSAPKNFLTDDQLFGLVEKDEVRSFSPFQTGELEQVHPFESQFTGMTKRKPKNRLQQEMARVNLREYSLYNRGRMGGELADFYTRQMLAQPGGPVNLNERMAAFIATDKYKNIGAAAREELEKYSVKERVTTEAGRNAVQTVQDATVFQRRFLEEEAKKIIKDANAKARLRVEEEQKDRPYNDMELDEWNRTGPRVKENLNALYREYLRSKGLPPSNISTDKDKNYETQFGTTSVLRWAVQTKKQRFPTKEM